MLEYARIFAYRTDMNLIGRDRRIDGRIDGRDGRTDAQTTLTSIPVNHYTKHSKYCGPLQLRDPQQY
jgi:hypothetical protein